MNFSLIDFAVPSPSRRLRIWLGQSVMEQMALAASPDGPADGSIAQLLAHACQRTALPEFALAYRLAVGSWFASKAEDYLVALASDTFEPGRSAIRWQIVWAQVARHFPAMVLLSEPLADHFAKTWDASRCPTLDEWLAAERVNALHFHGEQGASASLPQSLQRKLARAARKRRCRVPRPCSECTNPFQPERETIRRCQTCRALKRATRDVSTHPELQSIRQQQRTPSADSLTASQDRTRSLPKKATRPK
jgi:hypothetical protein